MGKQALALTLLSTAVALAAQTRAPESLTVEGRVVQARTGRPMVKMRIVLATPAEIVQESETDANGYFRFSHVAPGKYAAVPFASALAPMQSASVRVEVRTGETPDPLLLEIDPPGVISGVVSDATGESIPEATVAVRRGILNGRAREWPIVASAHTDDRGAYRIHTLPPGRYVVCVHAFGPGAPGPKAVPVCYPDSPDQTRAQVLVLKPGGQLKDISFQLEYRQGTTISGKVAGIGESGENPETIFVMLRPREGGATASPAVSVQPGGNFTLSDVSPGAYTLEAQFRSKSEERWVLNVDVGTTPVSGLVLTPVRPVTIRGLVRDAPPSTSLWLMFQGPSQTMAQVNTDGSFEVQDFERGKYQVYLTGPMVQNLYIRELRQGDTPRPDHTIDGANASLITLVVGNDSAVISGRVINAEDQPVARAFAALIPQGEVTYPFLYRSESTDRNGRFEFTNVPPGRFKLYAWTGVEEGAWFEPGFMEQWGGKGQSVTVAPNGRMTFSLRAVEVR